MHFWCKSCKILENFARFKKKSPLSSPPITNFGKCRPFRRGTRQRRIRYYKISIFLYTQSWIDSYHYLIEFRIRHENGFLIFMFLVPWVVPWHWSTYLLFHWRSVLLSILSLLTVCFESSSFWSTPHQIIWEDGAPSKKMEFFILQLDLSPWKDNKVGASNKFYPSLFFGSQDHPSSLKYAQNTLLDLILNSEK